MPQTKSRSAPKRPGASPEPEMDDGQLLGRFNTRDEDSAEAAFAALIRRHGPMVLRVCDQVLGDTHDAEDAFQASFLVLARRSGSIRRPELLGNWLYGVALRTAKEAKMRAGRRRRLEAPSAEVVDRGSPSEVVRPEVALICLEELEALHEEVARLPERYRIPVVLCELEGLTYQEVARRMKCPVSTIGVRLTRARERLRTRLIRRGIAPSAAMATAMFGAENVSALISAGLVDATAGAAVGFAASEAALTGLVPDAVVALTQTVLQAMKLARLKVATSALMVVGLTATLGWVGGDRPDQSQTSGRSLPPSSTATQRPGDQAPTIAIRPIVNLAPNSPLASAPIPPAPAIASDLPVGTGRDERRSNLIPTLASLRRTGREELTRGEALFFKNWVANDPASPHGDGLGPVYNETSCVACHGLGAPGGAGPESKNVAILTALSANGRPIPRGLEKFHPGLRNSRSAVLHRYGTDSNYSSWRRAFFDNHHGKDAGVPPDGVEETADARIRRIAEQISSNGGRGGRLIRLNPEPGVTLRVSERNTPALFGVGRIDEISGEVLVEEAKSQPAEVRGRVSRTRDGRVGRFGWKAQIASLHEFVQRACASELGLEVPGHSQASSPIAPLEKANGLDLTQSDCDAMVAYVRALPSPVVVDPDGPHGSGALRDGRQVFAEVGCASCHTPSLGDVRGIYSDLLLHDMGQILGDTGNYYAIEGPESPGDPSPNEWRTPPLWGFRDSSPYLHDGRAETLEEAVALHGGQAGPSARLFFALTSEERSWVESFLKSLVAPSTAAAPGVVLAAELESRIVPVEVRQAEALTRKRREEAEASEVRKQAEARQRRLTAEAAIRATGRFRIAANLDKSGKIPGAIAFYRLVVQDAPDSKEGRSSAERIAALVKYKKSP